MKSWLDDACSLADAVLRGEVRAVDALEASLGAIRDSKVNALTYIDEEAARRQAEEIDGRVKRAEIEGRASIFDESALSAVRQWGFTPAKANGQPVAVWMRIPVVFTLD